MAGFSIAWSIFFVVKPGGAADQLSVECRQTNAANHPASGTVYDGACHRLKSEPTPEAVEVSADLPYKYFGNNFSGKFHRPWCPYSQAMNVNHAVPFNFRWQAIRNGYAPCNFCLPQQWKSVHCVLLKQSSQQ